MLSWWNHRYTICLLLVLTALICITMEGTGVSSRTELLETLRTATGTGGDDPLYMQYKGTADNILPPELQGGAAILKGRTYPETPRRETCRRCAAYIYRTLLRPRSCEASGDIKVLIMLSTIPKARHIRDVIRRTWLSVTHNNTKSVRYMWLMGGGWPEKDMEGVRKESAEFGDILLDDFVDSYFNLTLKMMGAFHFAVTSCQRAQYVMRSADDIYVNIPHVLDFLKLEENKIQDAMFGPCAYGGTNTVRNKGTKYAVTKNEYAPVKYPPYCIGTAFMMTYKTMKKLFTSAENVPWFAMEDVYFGLVCNIYGIKLIHYEDFNHQGGESYNSKSKRCSVKALSTWRVAHIVSPEAMLGLWDKCPQNKTIPS